MTLFPTYTVADHYSFQIFFFFGYIPTAKIVLAIFNYNDKAIVHYFQSIIIAGPSSLTGRTSACPNNSLIWGRSVKRSRRQAKTPLLYFLSLLFAISHFPRWNQVTTLWQKIHTWTFTVVQHSGWKLWRPAYSWLTEKSPPIATWYKEKYSRALRPFSRHNQNSW